VVGGPTPVLIFLGHLTNTRYCLLNRPMQILASAVLLG